MSWLDLFAASANLHRLVQTAYRKLLADGLLQGTDYLTIGAAEGCFGGLGVGIAGMPDPERARRIAVSLLEIPEQFTLFYLRRGPGITLYCGPIANDQHQLKRRIARERRRLEEQLGHDHEFVPGETFGGIDSIQLGLEARTQEIMRDALGYHHADEGNLDVQRDEEGATITISDLSDESAAILLQTRLVTELPELELYLRIAEDGVWTVYAQEQAPTA